MANKFAPLPSAAVRWIDSEGRPTPEFLSFLRAISAGRLGPFVEATSDADAASKGVPLGDTPYSNAGVLHVRKT